jgi:hypothetical protein
MSQWELHFRNPAALTDTIVKCDKALLGAISMEIKDLVINRKTWNPEMSFANPNVATAHLA